MTKHLVPKASLFSILSLSLCLCLMAQQPQIEEEKSRPEGQAALRITVDQIRVDVTVQDKKGNLITGLQKQHFKVYEDKLEQEITFFEPVEAPMTAVMITEYSSVLNWEVLYEALMASYTFVDQMRQGDWIGVIAYDIKPEILVDFTQDKGEVLNSLRRLNFPAFRESNLYDALSDTLDRVQELDQRVNVILISSGLDTFSKKNLGEILARVKRTDATIYTISLGGNFRARNEGYMGAMARLDFYQADATLKSFSKITGGASFFPRFESEFPGIFQTISQLSRNQYSLGYVSSNPKNDGGFRKIRLEVSVDIDGDGKPDSLKVNHREGYLAKETTR